MASSIAHDFLSLIRKETAKNRMMCLQAEQTRMYVYNALNEFLLTRACSFT